MSEYERITFVINCWGCWRQSSCDLNGITATPAAQRLVIATKLPSSVTRMPPVWTVIKPDTEGMHSKHNVINQSNKLPGHLHQLSRPAITATPRGERCDEPMYKVGEQNSMYVLSSAGTVAKAFWPRVT